MGFNFSFFGSQEHRTFNYKPRFYDPEKEERKKRARQLGIMEKDENKPYRPGSHIAGSFRDGNYQKTKDASKNQKILGMVTMALLVAVIYLLYKYYPLLVESLLR